MFFFLYGVCKWIKVNERRAAFRCPTEMQAYIDMTAEYVLVQYVSRNHPLYIFVQHTDNEDFCEALGEQVVLLNEEYCRSANIHLFPAPMKASTVSDFSQEIPIHVISGRLDFEGEDACRRRLREWVCAARKECAA